MKVIEILKWEASQKAVALCYADESSDLVTELGGLTLSKGSLAYLADGDVYVLGDTWTKVGA